MFSELRQQEHGSRHAVLHRKYNAITGRSDVKDWKHVLGKIPYTRALHLLEYLVLKGEYAPSSKKVASNLQFYLRELDSDPVASKHPYSQADAELAERLAASGQLIPVEYVSDFRARYTETLKELQENPVYPHLPPFSEFCIFWYSACAVYGSPKLRRFSASHTKWREYLKDIGRRIGIRI